MKFVKGSLIALGALFALTCAFVLACAFNPELTDKVADFLYGDDRVKNVASGTAGGNSGNVGDAAGGVGNAGGIGGAAGNAADGLGNTDSAAGAGNSDNGGGADDAGLLPNNTSDIAEGLDKSVTSDYEQPDDNDIEIPENVSGKNGYEEPKDDIRQIDDDEADRLEDELSAGQTGDDLSFDPLYYPYYAMLDDKGKHLYRQIYANAMALNTKFAPVENVTRGKLKNVFSAVCNDHPELFFLDTAYSGLYTRDGRCAELDLQTNKTAKNLDFERAVFEESANRIASQAAGLPGDYEKEKFVHDAVIDLISYNLRAPMNQSAYSALVNFETVCAGYSRAFQYIMQKLGIPCYYCTGYAGENHAWNIVKLDDGYYNVDTTWDDTDGGNYDFFNKSDADYSKNHIRKNLSVYLPPCRGGMYSGLEDKDGQDGLRSIEDLGISADDVIKDIDSYYRDCYNRIVENGKGSFTFYNVIEGEQLFDDWQRGYSNKSYQDKFMESAVKAVGAKSCDIRLDVERLKDGRFLITHETNVR